MSCKSALYAANTSSQTMAVGDTINFGSIVRKYGCNCALSGGNVVVSGSGYYSVSANVTAAPTAAGTVTVTLYKDGTVIPGATQSIGSDAATPASISIPCLIRNACNCEVTITAILTGAAGTVSNAAIVVEKL